MRVGERIRGEGVVLSPEGSIDLAAALGPEVDEIFRIARFDLGVKVDGAPAAWGTGA